jgi:hypothetical protein
MNHSQATVRCLRSARHVSVHTCANDPPDRCQSRLEINFTRKFVVLQVNAIRSAGMYCSGGPHMRTQAPNGSCARRAPAASRKRRPLAGRIDVRTATSTSRRGTRTARAVRRVAASAPGSGVASGATRRAAAAAGPAAAMVRGISSACAPTEGARALAASLQGFSPAPARAPTSVAAALCTPSQTGARASRQQQHTRTTAPAPRLRGHRRALAPAPALGSVWAAATAAASAATPAAPGGRHRLCGGNASARTRPISDSAARRSAITRRGHGRPQRT